MQAGNPFSSANSAVTLVRTGGELRPQITVEEAAEAQRDS